MAQVAHSFEKEITRSVSLQYLLYLPDSYSDSEKEWPFMLFLHGAGERGDKVDQVKKHGPPKLVEAGKDLPFIIASPQCQKDKRWDPHTLSFLVDDIVSNHRIDVDRIYVTGLSMGGYGTWAIAGENPTRFAAVAPICGGGARSWARGIVKEKLPVWVFHGAKDQTVPLEESQRMVDAIKHFGGDVKFTIYPEAKHDSWTEAYDTPELYEWFLSHKRGS